MPLFPSRKKKTPLGIYIHVPFCRSKCQYCDFYSLATKDDQLMEHYLRAVCRHIRESGPLAPGYRVDTVYFGGGTPSYLGAERLRSILRAVMKGCPVTRDAEITLEANPDSACDIKALRTLHRAGFNRLSLGVQSADDGLLRAIGRIHTFAQVQQSVTAARKAGFRNISMDLIYGLPGQTMEQWEKTLSDAVGLLPEHLSCYGLKLEEGTPLYERRAELTLPDEEQQADMYLYAVEFLKQCGYEQYEISNFARPGFVSRHNMKYWLLQEYAGFGPGAYSDFGNVRYGYARDLEGYLRGELVLQESETLDADEREREYLMLRLRTVRGIEPKEFEYRFRQRFEPLADLLRQCAGQGLAAEDEQGWHLTPKGFLVSNRIIGLLQDELAREKNRRLQAAARGDYRMV